MYVNESIKRYLDDLAAKTPAPGGGSSAALAGAMASSLMAMALNFTIGNEKYRDFEASAREMLSKAEKLRSDFIRFFEEDTASYSAVAKAYKLSRDSDADKIKRKRAIKEAMKQATLTPLHVCQHAVEAMKTCPELARRGNKNLICDVEVPVRLLEAAFYSAKINVAMNQKAIEDEEFNKDVSRQMAALEKELLKYKELAEKEIAKVTKIRGKQ
jgi:formiminotetrahydrofolate cyclodeaminase